MRKRRGARKNNDLVFLVDVSAARARGGFLPFRSAYFFFSQIFVIIFFLNQKICGLKGGGGGILVGP